jgi:membrane fusion protein, multidrug efflux system
MATEREMAAGQPARRVPVNWVLGGAAVVAAVVSAFVWYYSGRVSTDDAQIDGRITLVATRVGGPIRSIDVADNQEVEAGDVLVRIAPEDYQVAVDKAAAELADAEAAARGADAGVPIVATTTASAVTAAGGGLEQARAGVTVAEQELDAARARLVAAGAHLREKQADATKATRDVDRVKGLVAKDEISQQQYDAAVAAAESAQAAVDAARSDVTVAEHAVQVANSRVLQARSGVAQAQAAVETSQTGPQQMTASRARAASAAARVQQAKAALAQARLNLEYTTIKAPAAGIVSRRTVEAGQVVQAGQPLLAVVGLADIWVTANFKETQLERMRPGQRAVVSVDALGDRKFEARVDSISAATGAKFSLLPPENATGNYVKVVQRVPVKIVFAAGADPEHQLRPGLSVVPTIYVR